MVSFYYDMLTTQTHVFWDASRMLPDAAGCWLPEDFRRGEVWLALVSFSENPSKQGLVNVPFWEYWTSPYSSHYRPYTQWFGDVQWGHLMTHDPSIPEGDWIVPEQNVAQCWWKCWKLPTRPTGGRVIGPILWAAAFQSGGGSWCWPIARRFEQLEMGQLPQQLA